MTKTSYCWDSEELNYQKTTEEMTKMPIGDEFRTEGRPYASAPQPTVITMPPPKSRLIYILLAIFLGGLGIHNFYAGRMGSAVAQLLITLLSCGILSLITLIWVIIDIITVRTDGEGRPFTEG